MDQVSECVIGYGTNVEMLEYEIVPTNQYWSKPGWTHTWLSKRTSGCISGSVLTAYFLLSVHTPC